MKPQSNKVPDGATKTSRIAYWSLTLLAALGFFMSSFMYLGRDPELMQSFSKAGYPVYFVTLLGLAKLLGAIALVNPWFPKLKEWAYAGFTFTLVGAVWTHIATSTPFVAPLVFLVLIATSYFFYQKVGRSRMLGYSEVNA